MRRSCSLAVWISLKPCNQERTQEQPLAVVQGRAHSLPSLCLYLCLPPARPHAAAKTRPTPSEWLSHCFARKRSLLMCKAQARHERAAQRRRWSSAAAAGSGGGAYPAVYSVAEDLGYVARAALALHVVLVQLVLRQTDVDRLSGRASEGHVSRWTGEERAEASIAHAWFGTAEAVRDRSKRTAQEEDASAQHGGRVRGDGQGPGARTERAATESAQTRRACRHGERACGRAARHLELEPGGLEQELQVARLLLDLSARKQTHSARRQQCNSAHSYRR